MALSTSTPIPTSEGNLTLKVNTASSVVFIGANGSGKTRLGVFIDQNLSQGGIEVHRIAAHKSLNLNPNLTPPSLEIAQNRLHSGHDNGNHAYKYEHRYECKPETVLLNDFDHLLSALYAENNDVSIAYRQQCIGKTDRIDPPITKIDKLKAIWDTALPHRELIILGQNIKTKTKEGHEYSASDMSDGERVIFYLIGQALIAKPDTLLIFDEPELHINKSILAKLWDEIESASQDCAFLYITHDIEFAASRHAAVKYALRSYQKQPREVWDIQLVPDDANIPDDIVAAIIGSRSPVLFVEGEGGSLDVSLYRRVYSDFTVIPVGSCEQVIRTVNSFADRTELHRVGCAGIIDADGRSDEKIKSLEELGIYCLPVSEVENLLLLPTVFTAIAEDLMFENTDAITKLEGLKSFVFEQAKQQIDDICLRHTKRQIDAEMKKISLSAKDINNLTKEFLAAANINVQAIFDDMKEKLSQAIKDKEYERVLFYYDNKGLLAEAAKKLNYDKKALEEFIGRALRSDNSSQLHKVLASHLPKIVTRPTN